MRNWCYVRVVEQLESRFKRLRQDETVVFFFLLFLSFLIISVGTVGNTALKVLLRKLVRNFFFIIIIIIKTNVKYLNKSLLKDRMLHVCSSELFTFFIHFPPFPVRHKAWYAPVAITARVIRKHSLVYCNLVCNQLRGRVVLSIPLYLRTFRTLMDHKVLCCGISF